MVSGINLITLLWSDGDHHIPCDYRMFDKKQDSLTKNDHFQALINTASSRGFQPHCVVFDSWYSDLDNLKLIRSCNWIWLTRLTSNRKVNHDRQGLQAVGTVEIGEAGRVVWLEGYGLIRVFKIVATDGETKLWATNRVEMNDLERVKWASFAWAIENYHRGLEQFCLIERAQVRSRRAICSLPDRKIGSRGGVVGKGQVFWWDLGRSGINHPRSGVSAQVKLLYCSLVALV